MILHAVMLHDGCGDGCIEYLFSDIEKASAKAEELRRETRRWVWLEQFDYEELFGESEDLSADLAQKPTDPEEPPVSC